VIALVREVSPALASCELSFLERHPIDIARAAVQHAAYCDALGRAGLRIEFMEPAPECPDGVFVEDAALVFDEVAVITRPGAESRRGEILTAASALAAYRPLSFILEPGTIDGGDVMRAGKDVFVGVTARTNRDGFDQLTAILARAGYRTTAVPVTGCLHLKTAVTAIDAGTLVINRRFVDASVFAGRRLIDAPVDEVSGGDVLNANGTVFVAASAPATRDLIARAGYRTEAVDVSEFEKAEAGVTCLSLLV
jgi:dimethylargininase